MSTTTLAPAYTARHYQNDALDAMMDRYFRPEPVRRQIVMMPTGMGKTVVFSLMPQHPKMAAHLNRYPIQQQKILVLAHREELLDQAADKIGRANPGLMVEVEQADRKVRPMTDIVVASVQTIIRRLAKFNPADFRAIVVDEAHHAVAPSYMTIFQHFGCLPPDDFGELKPVSRDKDVWSAWQRGRLADWDKTNPLQPLLVGFTATPKRGDRVGLEAVFEEIVYSMNMRDGIKDGWLTPLRAIMLHSDTSLDAVATLAGDFNVGQLSKTVNSQSRNQLAVKGWLEHAKGRKTVAFCSDVQHSHDLADMFQESGVNAVALSGATPPERRKQILREFSTGDIEVVTNCNILTEGYDEANIRCILHARPTKSSVLYIQMTGRGTRLSPGKSDCLIIDVVDVTKRHSLLTAPELFGLPVGFDAKGDDLMVAAGKVAEAQAKNPGLDLATLKSLDELAMRVEEIDLWMGAYNTEEVKQHSTMNWVRDATGYTLPLRAKGQDPEAIRIERDLLGKWETSRTVNGVKKQSFGVYQEVAVAFKVGENYIMSKRPENVVLASREAPWRAQAPTKGQITLAKMLKIPWERAQTCGELSDMIDTSNRMKAQAQARAPKAASRARFSL